MKMPQKIFLAHLRYTVKVREITPKMKTPSEIQGADAYTTFYDDQNCTIFLKKNTPIRVVAHEVTHVLRDLCIERHMDFTKEQEHMGYLMQYILGRILGEVTY